ncbi:hypothetical protein P7K49_025970 [Saguinus oedipus]|uniref:Uncharacterized protein n=1 Tax=Saguinus oedipus TaxID=9490 RepID=A0ABQ9UJ82_SAGOE|nr:hypothetical protein P7K49_025970 [Saguinus oedipus]
MPVPSSPAWVFSPIWEGLSLQRVNEPSPQQLVTGTSSYWGVNPRHALVGRVELKQEVVEEGPWLQFCSRALETLAGGMH